MLAGWEEGGCGTPGRHLPLDCGDIASSTFGSNSGGSGGGTGQHRSATLSGMIDSEKRSLLSTKQLREQKQRSGEGSSQRRPCEGSRGLGGHVSDRAAARKHGAGEAVLALLGQRRP